MMKHFILGGVFIAAIILGWLIPYHYNIDIYTAIERRNYGAVEKMVLEDPSILTSTNKFGESPLHYALLMREQDIAKLLIRLGASDSRMSNGYTAMHLACFFGDYRMVRLLFEQPTSLDYSDINQRERTLMHFAAMGYEVDIIRRSLRALNTKGTSNMPGKLLIDYYGRLLIVQLLLDKGMDINARDDKGFTPLDLAQDQTLIELLKNHGAVYNYNIQYVNENEELGKK